jgi:hypothetical protein
MSLTTHEEICSLEWSVYKTLHAQFADFDAYRRVRLVELSRADCVAPGDASLGDQERRARWAYQTEWDSSVDIRNEFNGNFELYASFRAAEEQGLTSLFGGVRRPVVR